MRNIDWKERRDPGEVARRAGGRRRYNKLRAIAKAERRLVIARSVIAARGLHRGLATRLARDLGVNRSTISRDLKAIFATADRWQRHDVKAGAEIDFKALLKNLGDAFISEDDRGQHLP